MNIEFEYSFKPISIQDINAFENKYKCSLPQDYKQFLLVNNGGKTNKRRKFKTSDETKEGYIISSIMLFFPLIEHDGVGVEQKYQQYNVGKIIPKKFFPIGEDPRRNLICMSLDGSDKGLIYHCEMDYFDYLKEGCELEQQHIKLIATSFSKFLNSLYEPHS